MKVLCRICGKAESEHHEFQSKVMPEGCVCAPGEWDEEVPLPCNAFAGSDRCDNCEHDEACHKERLRP